MILTKDGKEYQLVIEQKTQAGQPSIFLFQNGLKQIVGTLQELQSKYVVDNTAPAVKKKKGEKYKVMYGTNEVFSHVNWKLCDIRRSEMKKLPQFQSQEIKIV